MFSLRAYRHIQLRRIFSSLIYRQQSDKSDQLIETTSSSAVQPVSPHDSSLWATSETNPLIDYLSRRIKAVGPITVADFMQESIAHTQYGFYGRHEQHPRKDDSIQTETVRQMFAESIAEWIIKEHRLNSKIHIQIAEFGPGRGHLIRNVSQILHKHKFNTYNTFFCLYEPNRLMRRIQAETILGRQFDPSIATDYRIQPGNFSMIWIDDLSQIFQHFTFFLALEHLNGYPVHKFQKTKTGWKEVLIDWNPLTKRLQYVLALRPTQLGRLYEQYFNNLKDTDHVEISPRREMLIQKIFKHVSKCNGSVLIGDYAYWGKTQDTFRAFRKDQLVDPLSDPGNVEIVVDVDYKAVVARAHQNANLQFIGPVNQSNFLYNTHMNMRLEKSIEKATPEEQEAIYDDVERLVSYEFQGDRILYLSGCDSEKMRAPAGFSSIN